MHRIMQFRDFVEDSRTSMEVYADSLAGEFAKRAWSELSVAQYRPRLRTVSSRLPMLGNARMRFARYVDYPLQARARQGQVNHILDHGYAHLLRVLDPARTVITVHDIIPILAGRGRLPGITRPRRSWLAEWTARHYRKAARIIAISEHTKRDLVQHCGCDPERIEVIYYGLDPGFRPLSQSKSALRRHLGLPDPARLVLITGQEYYKNQATSVAVCERLRQAFPDLYLVRLGRPNPAWRALKAHSRLDDAVVEIPYLAGKQMPMLYNAVDAVLFPSWYEGFGWPPLEAMACGTPAVTSNAAALPEAVGDAGLTAAPDDVEGLAAHLERLFTDSGFRAERVSLGRHHAGRFTWRRNASRVANIYRDLAEKS